MVRKEQPCLSFQTFVLLDFKLWVRTTDLDHTQVGPALALRLEGVCREIANYLADQPSPHGEGRYANVLTHGNNQWDGEARTYSYCNGWEVLMMMIEDKIGKLDQEKLIQYLRDYFAFRPGAGESPDSVTARFELVRSNAREHGPNQCQIHNASLPRFLCFL